MALLKLPTSDIHYEEYGKGYPVLLFAPGFLSSRIERWRTNPARPGVPQDWLDPTTELSDRFRLIALDVRNAGQSRGRIGPRDDWHTYTEDHLSLLRHLQIGQCHVMGACIGVSFALGLAEASPGLVTAMVLQNPIGLVADNPGALEREFDSWASEIGKHPGVDASLLPGLGKRMFGKPFIFSVTREFVADCRIPMLIMPGNDLVHPAETSSDLARLAPNAEVLPSWKGPQHREAAMRRAREFFIQHEPRD